MWQQPRCWRWDAICAAPARAAGVTGGLPPSARSWWPGWTRRRAARRLINLMTAWNNEIKEFMGGMGINSIEALRGNRMMLRGLGLTDRELQVLGIAHAGE